MGNCVISRYFNLVSINSSNVIYRMTASSGGQTFEYTPSVDCGFVAQMNSDGTNGYVKINDVIIIPKVTTRSITVPIKRGQKLTFQTYGGYSGVLYGKKY